MQNSPFEPLPVCVEHKYKCLTSVLTQEALEAGGKVEGIGIEV